MELLTVPEFAKVLRMSEPWVRSLIYNKKIKFLRIGRRIRIPYSTVEEMLSKSLIEPRKPKE